MDELIKQAESLGIKVFKSWDEDRLKAEIAKVVAANAASSGDHAVAVEPITIEVNGDPDLIAKAISEQLAATPAAEPEPEPEVPCEDCGQLPSAEASGEYPCVSCGKPTLHAPADPEAEAEDRTVTIRNLKANPMRALGLDSYGSATFTEAQLSTDATLVKKIERGVLLGLLKVGDE